MPFSELIRRVSSHRVGGGGGGRTTEALDPVVAPGEKYYLRSVAHKTAAHLPASFPSLAADLQPGVILPRPDATDAALWPAGAYHSSVLRIASPGTALWTHYDTHDNLLAQVAGRKTVTLWPPGAEPFLYVEGSSSRVDDIDIDIDADVDADADTGIDTSSGSGLRSATSRRFPKFAAVSNRRRVATLGPGDALYIPALWFHHVLSHPSGGDGVGDGGGMSIAVNVFWRCLPAGEHDPADLFGNKDPPAARRASDLAARAGAAIAHLPEPHRTFYARRAVQRFAAQLGMELGGV